MGLVKDPAAELDYVINWSAWLKSDTIATSNFSVVGDLVISAQSHDDTTATVWFSGGKEGLRYDVVNEITTVGGRTDRRIFDIRVEKKKLA